jgi:adenylate cyclase
VPRVDFRSARGAPVGHFDVPVGATLFRAILRARLPLARSCRGVLVCAACQVQIVAGEVAPPDASEAALLARHGVPAGVRYACGARVIGPVAVATSYW